jgi:hypothetical protein
MSPERPTLSPDVVRRLESLVPSDELTQEFGGPGPGSLHHGWVQVTEVRLRFLTGFPILRLSPGAIGDRREVLAVPGRSGEIFDEVDERGRPWTSAFLVVHLPRELDWRRAGVGAVLQQEISVLYARLPPEVFAEPPNSDVEVDGTSVRVRVDRSGAVSVDWSVHRDSRGSVNRWDVTLLTRGTAVEVVRAVHEAGLFDPP